MANHRECRAIAQSPESLFDIVADVERYPEFLPLVSSARIVNRHENASETEQSLSLESPSYPRIVRFLVSTFDGIFRLWAMIAARLNSPSTAKQGCFCLNRSCRC